MSKNETYEEFVEKFKPKKTTDDCYTPPYIYEVAADWCAEQYGGNRNNFVRPFFPGGDYKNYPYKENDIVVDNPPFSILSKICAFYKEHNIRFFLFAPTLTIMCVRSANKIIVGYDIIYENGAKINTSFATNMGKCVISSAPELYQRLKKAQEKHTGENKRQLPRYRYPSNVITAYKVSEFSKYGIDFTVNNNECYFIHCLDEQKEHRKGIYGYGCLIDDKKAAEAAEAAETAEAVRRAEAEKKKKTWNLSERERDIIAQLS